MNEELKPCPFCGDIPTLVSDFHEANGNWFCHKIKCEQCYTSGDVYDTEQEAVDKWNFRYG